MKIGDCILNTEDLKTYRIIDFMAGSDYLRVMNTISNAEFLFSTQILKGWLESGEYRFIPEHNTAKTINAGCICTHSLLHRGCTCGFIKPYQSEWSK